MSYFETVDGAGRGGYTEGMGAAFTLTTVPNEELRAIQQDLQRMGVMAAGTGKLGADGRWGLHTAAGLGQARVRLGRTAAAFVVTNAGRNITIPDDFIAAIRAAVAPAAAESPLALPPLPPLPPPPDPAAAPWSPSPPGWAPVSPTIPAVEPAVSPRTRIYLVGGGIAVVSVLAAAFVFWPRKKVTANRRRRSRR